jgi:hypothetical protein
MRISYQNTLYQSNKVSGLSPSWAIAYMRLNNPNLYSGYFLIPDDDI